jgi:polyisoprenoid-binding protein YceI
VSSPEPAGDEHELLADRLPTGTWIVDPNSGQVNFRARALFVLPVSGYFERFSGELRVDYDGNASGALVIDTTSIQTGIDRRDEQLRGRDYFLAEQYPEMTFAVESLSAGRHDLELTGKLKIRDQSLPLSFPVTAIAHADHLHLEARLRIDLGSPGLGWAKSGVVGRSARANVALTLQPARRSAGSGRRESNPP